MVDSRGERRSPLKGKQEVRLKPGEKRREAEGQRGSPLHTLNKVL